MKFVLQLMRMSLLLLLGYSMTACSSTRDSSYRYLKKDVNKRTSRGLEEEIYGSIDISVLDTVGKKPPITSSKPTGSGSNSTLAKKRVRKLLKTAKSYTGTPYKWGGNTRKGIDCSGLVCSSFKSVNKKLPRVSAEQAKAGKSVRKKNIRVGDIVLFSSSKKSRVNHVGIVVQVKGRKVIFIHASTSKGVREDPLHEGYWKNRYRGARRIL